LFGFINDEKTLDIILPPLTCYPQPRRCKPTEANYPPGRPAAIFYEERRPVPLRPILSNGLLLTSGLRVSAVFASWLKAKGVPQTGLSILVKHCPIIRLDSVIGSSFHWN
jgi:hypothetical protein